MEMSVKASVRSCYWRIKSEYDSHISHNAMYEFNFATDDKVGWNSLYYMRDFGDTVCKWAKVL